MPFRSLPTAVLFAAILLNINLLAQIKSPDEFLPHRLGERFTPHFRLVEYFEEVAKSATATVKLAPIGATHEDRPQFLAIVSSPENIANLEQIRQQHLRGAGPKNTGAGKKTTAPVAIVWLSYTVHGNEAAGAEASMQVVYDLAKQTGPDVKNWLKNTVVIIDPAQNPDGYDRYSHWQLMAGNRFAQPNLASREHIEPWPGGRPNHYYFDLNRDWAWLTQIESENRIRAYHDWLPHIHADIHEQGKNHPYYFAPAAEPFHEIITPFQREFQTEIGKNHVRYFDKEGWLYFTREDFDLLYPSYGDTYPTYNGAIGMTYEKGGIGAGRAGFIDTGDTLLLKDRILHHYTTSISTVEVASKNAARLSENFEKYYSDAIENPRGQWKSFVFKQKNGDAHKIEQLTILLDQHHITYGMAGQSGTYKAFNYNTGKEENFTLDNSDIIVTCYQQHSDMAIALLEPETKLVDSITYDITAWSLPLAYGIEAYALKVKLEPKTAYAHCSFSPVAPGANAYAYLVRWQDARGPRFLSEVFKNGLRARLTNGPMETEGQSFPAGTLVLTRSDNEDLGGDFDKMISEAGMAAAIDVFPARTGFVGRGQDFGSGGLSVLERPEIALVYSDDCDENSFGHIWWHFEHELEYPLAAIPLKTVEKGGLDGFTTLILPEGISIKNMENLKAFVEKGGHIIAVGDAVKIFADADGFDLKTKAAPADDKKGGAEPQPFGGKGRASMSEAVYGAIVKNRVDPTNPLAFGLGEHYFSLKTNGNKFEFLTNSTAVWVGESYQSYGFIGAKLRPQLKQTMTAGRQKLGRGSVTYLIDPPLFRAFWQEGKLLFDNAVFFK